MNDFFKIADKYLKPVTIGAGVVLGLAVTYAAGSYLSSVSKLARRFLHIHVCAVLDSICSSCYLRHLCTLQEVCRLCSTAERSADIRTATGSGRTTG